MRLRVLAILLVAMAAGGKAAAAPIVVEDGTGATVRLERPARRIIALAPHVVENLYAVGAGAQLVGAVEYSDYPPAASSLLRVGSYNRFDVERILALEPDLVVGWESGNNRAQLSQLQEMGVTLYRSQPDTIDDVAAELAILGRLSGHPEIGERAAADFRGRAATLRARFSAKAKVPVFYQIWDKPLMTIGRRQIIGDIIELCGGVNVFRRLEPMAPQVSVEAVLEANAEVFVAGGMGQVRRDWLESWRPWKQLIAVQRDNLFFVPADWMQRHTPRLLDGAEMLCADLEVARGRRPQARR